MGVVAGECAAGARCGATSFATSATPAAGSGGNEEVLEGRRVGGAHVLRSA